MEELIMKKLTFLLICILLTLLCACAVANVEINESNFPDEEFLAFVLREIDTDGNRKLSDQEIANTIYIDCSYLSIENMKGIEFFTNLKYLECQYNAINNLDVRKNTALTSLLCYGNALTALDISKNTKLEYLTCNENSLKSLNLRNNTKLKLLSCDYNQLSILDISKNTSLVELSCSFNKLTELNVSKHTALKLLFCDGNKLTSLDVTKNTKLKQLSCYSNKLTKLNVSKNTKLQQLFCFSNKISKLDVSNCSALCKIVQKNKRIQRMDYDTFGEYEDLLVDNNVTVIAGKYVSKPAKPKTVTVDNLKYQLDSNKKTAVFIGAKDKKISSITIPATIKVSGKTYKVTEIAANACKNLAKLTKVTIGKNVTKIGKNAFSGCKKLKTISIQTEKLKKSGIGSACFKSINAKATFKVPKKMKKDYQTWLVKTGKAPETVKFK